MMGSTQQQQSGCVNSIGYAFYGNYWGWLVWLTSLVQWALIAVTFTVLIFTRRWIGRTILNPSLLLGCYITMGVVIPIVAQEMGYPTRLFFRFAFVPAMILILGRMVWVWGQFWFRPMRSNPLIARYVGHSIFSFGAGNTVLFFCFIEPALHLLAGYAIFRFVDPVIGAWIFISGIGLAWLNPQISLREAAFIEATGMEWGDMYRHPAKELPLFRRHPPSAADAVDANDYVLNQGAP